EWRSLCQARSDIPSTGAAGVGAHRPGRLGRLGLQPGLQMSDASRVRNDSDGGRANVKVPPSAKIALDALYEAIAESGEVVSGGAIPLKTRTIHFRRPIEPKISTI